MCLPIRCDRCEELAEPDEINEVDGSNICDSCLDWEEESAIRED